ncbi:MAG: exodeoxyribonuclease VII large subunit [Chloroflexi bacterium]|nr:exodeoxyribonuclease VII large subunit [Chloroflexota bacterium]
MLRRYTVGEVLRHLGELLAHDWILSDVWIEGEIGSVKRSGAGHCYFTLRQDGAVIEAVCWSNQLARLSVAPRDGLAVLAHSRLAVYEKTGRLQCYVDALRPLGPGTAAALLEGLRARLLAEGVFDPSRKRPLPAMPRRIGVATSHQGAALHDIMAALERRFPPAELLVVDCLVQGAGAPQAIVAALQHLYGLAPDVIILARGGGNADDLAAFNDEQVVRTIRASPVPLVTGIGHETDHTLADLAADLRGATPTAAAEHATSDRPALLDALAAWQRRLDEAIDEQLAAHATRLTLLYECVCRHAPAERLRRADDALHDAAGRLQRRLDAHIRLMQAQLAAVEARLGALDPLAVLQRGYAVVQRQDDGTIVSDAAALPVDTPITITLARGRRAARITEEEP